MACCGKHRQEIRATLELVREKRPPRSGPVPRTTRRRVTGAYFEYLGKTGLTVLGPLSRKRYRFNGNGAVVLVDPRDAASLDAVPGLRRLSGPG